MGPQWSYQSKTSTIYETLGTLHFMSYVKPVGLGQFFDVSLKLFPSS